ncbi:cytochrome c biogenesis CcdA family protein [Chitinivibrio alkaliphilus]|uniref:Cytochrome c-type biogenesis protein n=1 Tax=Chitinivibrio alkaliphilus ACht1 TaxID=1313304 RepID=U7DBY1_9BACT|nr:cytochrome c biogenesis CcdA family protein [Chitinivibrio alkaliphilus]ERP31915.1 cytochrome c-type biogenesis protein [Chitinivibrio alkaliphilus ACht1]
MTPLDISLVSILLVFFAGVASVASPCVFPLLPIIMTGTEQDSKYRPLLIVLGITLSFVLMGVITSAFSSLILGRMRYIEIGAGILIIIFGALLAANINLFKHITILQKIPTPKGGGISGFFLGVTLGIVWIPCIGPMLSGVLAMVATEGTMAAGILLLFIYSFGLAIPLLLAGYATQVFRKKVGAFQQRGTIIRIISALILIGFGVYIAL